MASPASETDLIPSVGWAAEYSRFYQEVFGLTVDFTGVEISVEKPGFGWALYIPQGMTANQAWAKAKDNFVCRSYVDEDFDSAALIHDLAPTKAAYAMRFRDRVKTKHIQNVTILERILLELWYHWKTGGHLDPDSTVRHCMGSRYPDGCSLGAYYEYGVFTVDGGRPVLRR